MPDLPIVRLDPDREPRSPGVIRLAGDGYAIDLGPSDPARIGGPPAWTGNGSTGRRYSFRWGVTVLSCQVEGPTTVSRVIVKEGPTLQ